MIAPRDFVLLKRMGYQEDGSYVNAARSINFPYNNNDEESVRAVMHDGGWILTPKGPLREKTQVVFLTHVDPKATIPRFILKSVVKRKANLVRNIRDGLESYLKATNAQ
eukprot:TRINITY_DN3096_c0_g1_i1.p1 TRINITY_DN3096_c0_g1~~TRINITY_DN3096_c0_g1_i1.p1  ORF type:complete len:109 (+),score=12.27 TRINITY_DN3096_c0_g1_i1:422-748(+)